MNVKKPDRSSSVVKQSIALFLLLLLLGFFPPSLAAQKKDSLEDSARKAAEQTKADAEKIKKEVTETARKAELLLKNSVIFFTSLISYENPFEDFADIFRNQCQVDDIGAIQQNMEKTGKDLRRAVLAGQEKDFEALKKELINLTIELHYIRNFIDTRDGAYVIRDEEDVYQKIAGFSSSGLLSDQELRSLISQLSVRYQAAGEKYRECNIFADWKKVQQRIEKLAKALDQAGKDFGNTLEEPFHRLAAKSGDNEKGAKDGVKRSAKEIIGGYLAQHVSVNLPAVPTKLVGETIEQVAKTVRSIANSGQYVSQGKSIEQLRREIGERSYAFAVATETAELRAKYDIIYGEAGDNAIADILKKVDELNGTINGMTQKVLPPMLSCLAEPNAKQCPSIK